MMQPDSSIFVAGHQGLVGSAILRKLKKDGYFRILTRSRKELDLADHGSVGKFFRKETPDYVFLAAAKVGGVHANNTYPAEFIYNNLSIQTTVIHQAYLAGVKRLLFLGSSCIYPRLCPQPIKERYLMTGPLEPTNSPYAVAKIAGIEMCHAYNRQYGTQFIPVMPTNLYGPNDNFDLYTSHVLPAIIRKCHLIRLATQGDMAAIQRDIHIFGDIPHDIKSHLGISKNRIVRSSKPKLVIWGTGTSKRELLHVDDLADAVVYLMNQPRDVLNTLIDTDIPGTSPSCPLINIGTGEDRTISELANIVKHITDVSGEIVYDATKPDGTPRKLLDVGRLKRLNWHYRISLEQGIRQTYDWYMSRTGGTPSSSSA